MVTESKSIFPKQAHVTTHLLPLKVLLPSLVALPAHSL